ncbi:MAG: hypothetical protein LUG16_07745 [Candidatus Gastranaerophilales bacterium]|nr:hypothetical protein [Candidatus Gastranaerophilales bacterium]
MVVQSTQRKEIVTKLKKSYSVLQQTVIKIAIKEGAGVGDYSFMENDDFFDSFIDNINVLKLCKTSAQGCFTSSYLKALNGNNWAVYNRKNSLVSTDGIAYGWDKSYCSGKGLTTEDSQNCIGRFIIDLNGDKSPNRFGYDVFFFTVINGKGVIPAGAGNNSSDCKKGGNGITCAAKVLKENAITYL